MKRVTNEQYQEALEIVTRYNHEQQNPDDCCVCGNPTRPHSYYAGDNPMCSQCCLTEWDDEHPNPFSESEDFYS